MGTGLPIVVDAFAAALQQMLLGLSHTWEPPKSLAAIQERSMARLVARRLAEYQVRINCTHPEKAGVLQCSFYCSGPYDHRRDLEPAILRQFPSVWRDHNGPWKGGAFKETVLAVRLTEDGALAAGDVKKGHVGPFLWLTSEEFKRRFNAKVDLFDVRFSSDAQGGDAPKTIAAAQANASVGDIQNNIAVAGPGITIDNSGVADAIDKLTAALTQQQSGHDDPLLTLDDLAFLACVVKKTISNKRPPAPAIPSAGSNPARYRWSEIRAWMIEHWPDRADRFPAAGDTVAALLNP